MFMKKDFKAVKEQPYLMFILLKI